MLDSQPLLGLLAPFLSLHDLWRLRSVSRHCRETLPRHTVRLVAHKVQDADSFGHVVEFFPLARDVVLREVSLPALRLNHLLTRFSQWRLTRLELSEVWNLTDASVRLVTQNSAGTLERIVLRQCYLLKTPAILGGPKLKSVAIENCLMTQFHDDTTWPALEELRVSSRVLTTIHARHLHKQLLARSRIQKLDLSDCFMVEQILIDPGELPLLHTLLLRSCLGLKRLHVASSSLEVINLSLCGAVEVVVLELHCAKWLDLSFLQQLTHLLVRSESLGLLNLRACAELTRETLRIECPAVARVHLEGTRLRLEDVQRAFNDDV